MLIKLESLGSSPVITVKKNYHNNTGTSRTDRFAISISRVSVLTRDKNPQFQAVSASHKEGMLNWWQTLKPETRVLEKGPGLHALSRSLCHEVCPVRNCSASVVPRQEEISGAATDWALQRGVVLTWFYSLSQ